MSAPRGDLADSLLAWYDRAGRDLPWRSKGSGRADPYHVWLSEIMLQQTGVAVVIPYFQRFLAAWPTIAALASAPLEDVLQAWAGLGYYARARNLHKCARVVIAELDGKFPEDEAALKALPGIGEYTAAAIAAIAFGHRANVVDGNVERVMARLRLVSQPLPKAKPRLRKLAAEIAPDKRPGDYAQALMDLGATICRPRKPACGDCPWAVACLAGTAGVAEEYPRRIAKKPKPVRRGIAYWVRRNDEVLLVRRPDRGLLGGMLCFPGSEWIEDKDARLARERNGRLLPGEVRHTFTHFHLILQVLITDSAELETGQWIPVSELVEAGLPSVMKKIANHALAATVKEARLLA